MTPQLHHQVSVVFCDAIYLREYSSFSKICHDEYFAVQVDMTRCHLFEAILLNADITRLRVIFTHIGALFFFLLLSFLKMSKVIHRRLLMLELLLILSFRK